MSLIIISSHTISHHHLCPPYPYPSFPQVLTVAIEPSGKRFATGGLDKEVRVWAYDEGELLAVGRGHSAAVSRVAVSPDGRTVVSVGADGAVFFWGMPTVEAGSDAVAAPSV